MDTKNKNAFQWDAYHRLLTISQHALGGEVSAWGVSTQGGGVYPNMQWGRHPLPVDRQTPVKT